MNAPNHFAEYSNSRYYSPELGRWLNRDPIGEKGGWNLYGMVGNNSVGKRDYLGRELYYNPETGGLQPTPYVPSPGIFAPKPSGPSFKPDTPGPTPLPPNTTPQDVYSIGKKPVPVHVIA